jgi:FlaA1/EpsC-like NDP-sugar epimerase
VIPLFQSQIQRGGPITITDPEIRRYFMTISEASQLVIQAGALGEGNDLFLLDMGSPVRIIDLARDMIRLAGHDEKEIPIRVVGLRPGRSSPRSSGFRPRRVPRRTRRSTASYRPG